MDLIKRFKIESNIMKLELKYFESISWDGVVLFLSAVGKYFASVFILIICDAIPAIAF